MYVHELLLIQMRQDVFGWSQYCRRESLDLADFRVGDDWEEDLQVQQTEEEEEEEEMLFGDGEMHLKE